MIDRDAKPIAHHPVRAPIETSGRKRIVTREDVENGLVREPDPALYDRNPCSDTWVLRA